MPVLSETGDRELYVMASNRLAGIAPAEVGEVRIQLFEGTGPEVESEVNEFLREAGSVFSVIDVGYNYQGDEFNQAGARVPRSSSHGVCLVLQRR